MLSNQLNPDVKNQVGITSAIHANYGFGLGVAVRQTAGIAVTSGSVGDFSWPGAYGTYWWGDPREQLAVVWMISAPGVPGPRYKFQQMIRTFVNQAILD